MLPVRTDFCVMATLSSAAKKVTKTSSKKSTKNVTRCRDGRTAKSKEAR